MTYHIRPTKTGYCLIGLILLFYSFSLISQISLIYLIIGIIIGCFVINVLAAYRSVKYISIQCPSKIKTIEDKHIQTSITIANNSSFKLGFIEVFSEYGVFVKVNIIKANELHHILPELIFAIRGVYKLSDLKVHSIYPFGLISVSRKAKLSGEILVYPKVYNCTTPKAAGLKSVFGGSFKGINKTVYGSDFAGVRPMHHGDPVKFIHWKSSSKGLGMMIKEFNEELSGYISIVIDTSSYDIAFSDSYVVPLKTRHSFMIEKIKRCMHRSYRRYFNQSNFQEIISKCSFTSTITNPENKNTFGISKDEMILDCAVRAAGSLIFSALDSGHHVELIDLSDLKVMHIPPLSDGDMVLEFLTEVKPMNIKEVISDKNSDHILTDSYCFCKARLDKTLNMLSSKSSLCFVLTDLNDNIVDYLTHVSSKNRVLSVYLPEISLLTKKNSSNKHVSFKLDNYLYYQQQLSSNHIHMYSYGRSEICEKIN